MALPINSLSPLRIKDYGIQLFLKSGDKDVPIHTLSRTKQRQDILETIVEVYEYQELSIVFLDWHWNKDVTMTFPLVHVSDETENIELYLSKKQQHKHLYHPYQDAIFPWPCGTFIYEVVLDRKTFYGAIKIISHHFSQDQFKDITTFLEAELKGLTQNYYHEVQQLHHIQPLMQSSQLLLLSWLDNRFTQIITSLQWIENENQTNVKRHYQVESHPGHMDQNSMKWRNTFKGSILGETKFYNRKHTHNVNLRENQLVKYQAKQILQRIDHLHETLDSEAELFYKQLRRLEDTIRKLEAHLGQIKNPLVTTKDHQLQQNHLYGKKKDLESLLSRIAQMESLKDKVLHYKQRLQFKIQQLFWQQIDDIHPSIPSVTMQKGYVMFKKLWDEFFDQTNAIDRGHNELTQIPLFHPTAKIYEYYAYILVIKQFIERGYNIEQDTLAEQLKLGHINSELQPGTTVILTNEESHIHIVYDEEVEHRAIEAINNQTFFFSKFSKKQPDIRVDLFHNLNEQKVYHSSIVIEVKYSPLRNIFSEDGNTKAMEQMNEYIGIKYYCPVRNEYFNRIREVLCFYPGHSTEALCKDTEAGKFIQLYPEKEKIVGLEAFNLILDKWMKS